MPYFTQADLESAIGENIVDAIYDDDGDGSADAAPIAACLAYGTSQCDSFLRAHYGSDHEAVTLPLSTVPDEVKFAALDFGIAYSVRRRPDVVKAMNMEPWTTFRDSAVDQMKRYCESIQRFPVATVGTPATVGVESLPANPDDDEVADPRWGDFGDFS